MTKQEIDAARNIVRAFTKANKPSVEKNDGSILLETPYLVKVHGHTVCYCDDKEGADLCARAFDALNLAYGMDVATLAFGDSLRASLDKAIEP